MAQAGMSEEKRRLVEQSERYRQAMSGEFRNLRAATAWVPKTVGVMRTVSPLLAVSAPLLGLFLRKKRKADPMHERDGRSQGLVANALLAFELLRKARSLWESFQRRRHRSNDKPEETSPRPSAPKRA